MYEFAGPSPGLGAVHALEIPFVFDARCLVVDDPRAWERALWEGVR